MTFPEAVVQAADRVSAAWEHQVLVDTIGTIVVFAMLFAGVAVVGYGAHKGWWS